MRIVTASRFFLSTHLHRSFLLTVTNIFLEDMMDSLTVLSIVIPILVIVAFLIIRTLRVIPE